MSRLSDTGISRAIIEAYHERLLESVLSDVIIVGAGPAGMTAAVDLARRGLKVTLLEKRLSPGGGIWAGGMAMNVAVVQDDAVPLLEELGIRHRGGPGGLHTVDAMELAAGLCLRAVQAGAGLLNLTTVEDVLVLEDRVAGVVANRSVIYGSLPVDPITFSAKAVVDGSGHDAAVVACLRKRRLLAEAPGEGPMDATAGEAFVVERAGEVFPGLWIAGMSVCATLGGPRMGPIFGGMLLSGQRVAELIATALQ